VALFLLRKPECPSGFCPLLLAHNDFRLANWLLKKFKLCPFEEKLKFQHFQSLAFWNYSFPLYLCDLSVSSQVELFFEESL